MDMKRSKVIIGIKTAVQQISKSPNALFFLTNKYPGKTSMTAKNDTPKYTK